MSKIDKTYEIIKTIKLLKDSLRQTHEKAFKDLNLTGPQSFLLRTIGHNGPMKVSELSKKMALSNSTVSGILDRLENQSYIVRKKNITDKRVVIVDLHDDFRKIVKEKFCSFDKTLNELMKDSKDEDLNQILTGLQLLNNILRREGVNHV